MVTGRFIQAGACFARFIHWDGCDTEFSKVWPLVCYTHGVQNKSKLSHRVQHRRAAYVAMASSRCSPTNQHRTKSVYIDVCTRHVFTGEFRRDARHGQGIRRSPTYTYEGAWARDLRHGFGTFSSEDEGVYEGFFQRGTRCIRSCLRNLHDRWFQATASHGTCERFNKWDQ